MGRQPKVRPIHGCRARLAGEQPELVVVEPEARATLVRFDSTVSHYEILAAPDDAPS